MLWEHEQTGKCSHSFFEFSQSVVASAPVAERSVKLKGLMTHRFHKAQVY